MPANLPVAFAEVMLGGLLLDKGLKNARGAFSGGTAQAATPAASAGATSGAGTTSSKAAFSANQKAFASELQSQTGLDPAVIAGWMAAEEPIGASSGWGGLQDWLNVGITDSGPMGSNNPAWRDPVQAADMTAEWMKGVALPGFGTAAAGIQRIVGTAGQSISAQVQAIQSSGWASSGYPDLAALVAQYAG